MSSVLLTCLLAAVYTISSVSEFKSLNLAAGDVVEWKDGVYDDVKVALKAQGTQEGPVVFKARTPGKVIFTGASGITLDGSHLVCEGFSFTAPDTSVKYGVLTCAKGSHDCVFRNISIDGSGSGASEVDSKWVNLHGRHNEVSHCTFTDKRNMGCLFVVWLETGIAPEHVIAFNRFTRPYTHYTEKGHGRNGQEAIRIGTSDFSMQDAGCRVYGNYFYNCFGELAEIISNKSCENVYEGNVFEDCKGTLTLRHGNRCTVRGNYFLSNGTGRMGGVRIIGEGHIVEGNVMLNLTGNSYKSGLSVVMGESNAALTGYWTVRNTVIRNNVLVNCKEALCINAKSRDGQDTAPKNIRIEGNTIVCTSPSQRSVVIANPTPAKDLHWKGNIIYGGRQNGTKLHEVSEKPSVKDYIRDINIIKDNSGKQW